MKNKKMFYSIIGIFLLIVTLIFIFLFKDKIVLDFSIEELRRVIESNQFSELIFIGIWTLRLILFIPGVTLMLLGGIIFEPSKAFLLSMGILKRKQFPGPCHIISGLSLKNGSEIFRPYNFKKSRESRLGKGFRFHDQIHGKCLKRNKIQKSGLVCCVFFSKSWICLVRSNSCGSGNIGYQFSMVTRYAGWRNFFWKKKLVQINPWCTTFFPIGNLYVFTGKIHQTWKLQRVSRRNIKPYGILIKA